VFRFHVLHGPQKEAVNIARYRFETFGASAAVGCDTGSGDLTAGAVTTGMDGALLLITID
jgi:hypothetical protein